MSEAIDKKIEAYMILKERTQHVFDNVNEGNISAEAGVSVLADIVKTMLNINIVRAEQLKKIHEKTNVHATGL